MNNLSQLSKKWASIIAVALLLRVAVVVLQGYARTEYGSVLAVFGLPLLALVSLIIVALPLSDRTRRIVRIGWFALPVLMINAAWRTFEYFQTLESCDTVSGGAHESFCLTVGMQVFVHVPFLVLGAIAMWQMNNFSQLAKRWAPVISAAFLLHAAISVLQIYARTDFGSVFALFVLPLLALVSLIIVALPLSDRTRRIIRIGWFALPVLMINSAWRTFEFFPILESCYTTSGGALERFCDAVGMQLSVYVPFLVLAALAMYLSRRKISQGASSSAPPLAPV